MDGAPRPGFVPPGWRRRGVQTFEGFNRGHWYPTGAQYFTNDGRLLHPDIYEPTYQADLAMGFLKRNRNHPFFCYLSWGPPHTPYKPPPQWNIYNREGIVWRDNVPAAVRQDAWTKDAAAGYYGLSSSLDHELGRILRFLDDEDLTRNTLVVFTSDHGDMLGSHGAYEKSKPEEESLHIPLYMRLPGRIPAGTRTETLLSSVDLMPTILTLCGLKTPSSAIGQELSSAALGIASPKVDFVYAEGQMRLRDKISGAEERRGAQGVSLGKEWRAVVTPQHKLAVRYDGTVAGLFDREKDPYEMHNLAEERSAAALRRDLLGKLQRRGRELDDRFPNPTPPAKASYTDQEVQTA
jgi:arylsulfatase A-like enzyme